MLQLFRNIKNLWVESFSGLSKEVWLLSLITLINRSGTVVIIFLSIYLTEQLNFTKSEVGIVIGCFGVGSVIGAWVGGILTDKIGYYKVMFFSLFAVGFFFFGMAYVSEFYTFCGIVIATCIVGDMYGPASQASISAYSKKENHSRTLSLIRLSINLGFAVGSGAVGFIAGAFGYYWLFIIDGGTCLIASFAFILIMTDKKAEVAEEKAEAILASTEPVRSPYTDVWFILFMISLALCSVPFFQLFTAYPVFLKEEMLYTEFQFGAIMAFNGLLLFFFEMPIIHTLTKMKKEMQSVTIGAAFIALSFFAFNIFGFYTWVIILAMVLIALGEILNFPFSTSVALSRSHPSNRGRYMGMFSMTFSIVFIFAPWAGMKIIEIYGYQMLWSIMGVLALVGTVGLYILSQFYHPVFIEEEEEESKIEEHLIEF